ncbi:MAG: hypothetical protein CSA62_11975 [Planctomycetota bacterium]|nr:MAG: hypothetical protein CSA62_11975 [Planctomycetota bacterium]
MLVSSTAAQSSSRNSKLFFTPLGTQTGRQTNTQVDTLYMMPDRDFRIGKGTVTGFELVLEDQEQSTSERVELAVVKSLGQEKPDSSSSGLLLKFTVNLFGTSQGRAAYKYTLTPAKPATQVPGDAGIRIVLPKPRHPSTDICTVHYRPGNSLKMSPQAPPRIYAHYLSGSGSKPWFSPRSTLHAGLLFGEPVVRFKVRSAKSAYGSEQTIIGPESVHVHATRGDQGGWSFAADGFKPGSKDACFAIPMLGSLAKSPLATPWGELLLDPKTLTVLSGIALDAKGTAETGFARIPAKISLTTQALFLRIDKSDPKNWKVSKLQLSDASRFHSF